MSKILIKNANLISMDEKKEKILYGIDILIENNIIRKIQMNIQESADKVINATGKVVMPGLVNTHAHVPMSIFRETVDGYKTQEWLEEKIWPMEEKLTEEDVYYSSLLTFIEMIYSGNTTINDMYYLEDAIVKAALKAKVRIQLTRTLMDSDGNGERRYAELKRLIKNVYNKYENISLNVGMSGFYICSEKCIKIGAEIAKDKDLPIHIHFCEAYCLGR